MGHTGYNDWLIRGISAGQFEKERLSALGNKQRRVKSMDKCVFCKNHSIDGYRRCEITGQIKRYPCRDYSIERCKYGKKHWFARFLDWFEEHFD